MCSIVTVYLNNPNHPPKVFCVVLWVSLLAWKCFIEFKSTACAALYLQHRKLFKVMDTALFINRIWQPLSLWSGHLFTHSLIKDLWVNDDELITDIVTDLSQWDVTFWMKWFGVQKWLCHSGKYSLYRRLRVRGRSPCVRGAHRWLFKATGARVALSCDWKTI